MQQAMDRGSFDGVAPTATGHGRAAQLERTTIGSSQNEQPTTERRSPGGAGGTGSWQSAYYAAVAGQVWYALQWVANGVTTAAGVTLLLAVPVLNLLRRIDLAINPWYIYGAALVAGIGLHVLLTSIERDVWSYQPQGAWLSRMWRWIQHVFRRSLTSLVSITVVFAVDIGTAYYGAYWVLAGRTLPFGTGWTLPKDERWFMMAIGVLAVWIATMSEPGYRAARARRIEIATYKERYFARLEEQRSRASR
jgi:hypothetical protein